MKKTFLLIAMFVFANSYNVFAQFADKTEKAIEYVKLQASEYDLEIDDVSNIIVTDAYETKRNNRSMLHVYLQQSHKGVPIESGRINMIVTDSGKKRIVANSFEKDYHSKIVSSGNDIGFAEAISVYTKDQGIQGISMADKRQKTSFSLTIKNEEQLLQDIYAYKSYIKNATGQFQLVYIISALKKKNADAWEITIDANTGNIISKKSNTLHCNYQTDHSLTQSCLDDHAHALPASLAGESYKALVFPISNPLMGAMEIVTEPADLLSSPFGWHDDNLDGVDDYTVTRGNNINAGADKNGDDVIDNGSQPDGGTELQFDFPVDFSLNPDSYIEASTVNLFYATNYFHDFMYAYGWDEPGGNYQLNHHTGTGGVAGDLVLTLAHQGVDIGSLNNANFSPGTDGVTGVMRMFLWGSTPSDVVSITEPAGIAGTYDGGSATYGAAVTDIPVVGELDIVSDESEFPSQGCFELVNDLAGKIALVDRGGCFFAQKSAHAENAGAIGVIICNFENAYLDPAPDTDGVWAAQVTIPTVMLPKEDCDKFKIALSTGPVTASIGLPTASDTVQLDGSLDNGIVIHEYTHGLSNRLVGGPSTTCLGNAEQMGEGWSDFYALVTSVREGDTGPMKKGMGVYVSKQGLDGPGIRGFPYSTDMNINPWTYNDISGEGVHAVGAVWSQMLWEMYWALVEKYGFDTDLVYGTGGNNIAVDLVTTGMKLTGCNPSFEDGRDAILFVDEEMYDGENEELIWTAFAKRGLGWSADSGDANNTSDGTEGYDLPPYILKEIVITKSVSEEIVAGQEIEVNISVTNWKDDPITNVIISDDFVDGLGFSEELTGPGGADVSANSVSWTIPTMASQETVTISYTLNTDEATYSTRNIFDNFEDGESDWEDAWELIDLLGLSPWAYTDERAFSGSNSAGIANLDTEEDQVMQSVDYFTVPGDNPYLKFQHLYNTEPGVDGGIVQIQREGSIVWEYLDEKFIRNGYPGIVQYGTFVIPFLYAFNGNSSGWIPSYADLTEYKGENVKVRFRFASDENTGGAGWWVDDFEILDLFTYNTDVCVNTAEGDMKCANGGVAGTIVLNPNLTDVTNIENLAFDMNLYPNPGDNYLQVTIASDEILEANIELFESNGRLIQALNGENIQKGNSFFGFNTSDLASGMYYIKLTSGNDSVVEKWVKN